MRSVCVNFCDATADELSLGVGVIWRCTSTTCHRPALPEHEISEIGSFFVSVSFDLSAHKQNVDPSLRC